MKYNINDIVNIQTPNAKFKSIYMGVEGGDEVTQLDEARFKYLNLQFKDDCLVGVSSLGHTENMGVARGLIRGQVHLGEWKKRLQANPVRLMEAYLACSIGAA